MNITFLGAAREVTGSCYLLTVGKKSILIDCGMEQGPNIYENQALPVAASALDAVVLTHAHIDHSGLLPLLYKKGYRNKIYLTRPSRDLCQIMLLDSAHIQEFEAQWRNRKARRGTNSPYEPLYTRADVEGTIKLFRGCDYESVVDVLPEVKVRFIDAGHLLGSASVEITAIEDGIKRVIVFSGDIGNPNKPIIRNPHYPEKADYVVMESTYGDREHGSDPDYVGELAGIIQRTFDKGGNVVIPTFAVGRMQELLYFMREIKLRELVKGHGDFLVYVDSPLAVEATKIYSNNVADCCDDATRALLEQGVNPIGFPGLRTSVTSDDSKAINLTAEPKVILSASGMCEAGRIRHHLKHNLWKENCTVVFVGYQVQGTLGRILLDGAKTVRLFNEEIAVNANVVRLEGTSSHADCSGLIKWALSMSPEPTKYFITHGEDEVAAAFAEKLWKEHGLKTVAPYNGAIYDLIDNECIFRGNTVKIKKQDKPEQNAPRRKFSPSYAKLQEVVGQLNRKIDGAAGYSNHDLRELTAAIEKLIKKI